MTLPARWTPAYAELMAKRKRRAARSRARLAARGQTPPSVIEKQKKQTTQGFGW